MITVWLKRPAQWPQIGSVFQHQYVWNHSRSSDEWRRFNFCKRHTSRLLFFFKGNLRRISSYVFADKTYDKSSQDISSRVGGDKNVTFAFICDDKKLFLFTNSSPGYEPGVFKREISTYPAQNTTFYQSSTSGFVVIIERLKTHLCQLHLLGSDCDQGLILFSTHPYCWHVWCEIWQIKH